MASITGTTPHPPSPAAPSIRPVKTHAAKLAADKCALLNVGAGLHASSEWTNLDMAPAPDVIRHDIRKGLPFAHDTFDAVYSSHVLEHLAPADGDRLISEMKRVLKLGGIARVVVPDLERTCRAYLERIEAATREPDEAAVRRYRWIKIELLDQLVRERPGGTMVEALRGHTVDPEDVRERIGDELLDALEPASPRAGWRARVARTAPGARLAGWLQSRVDPRRIGEVHRWMYDRFDLADLLGRHGFTDIEVMTHDRSRIPGWDVYRLDSTPGGEAPRKPDSLFLEAVLG